MSGSQMHGKHAQRMAEQSQQNNPGNLHRKAPEEFVDLLLVTLPTAKELVSPQGERGLSQFNYVYYSLEQRNGLDSTNPKYVRNTKTTHKPGFWDRLTDVLTTPQSASILKALEEAKIRILYQVECNDTCVMNVIHYRLKGTVNAVPTYGALVNAVLSVGTVMQRPIAQVMADKGIAYLGVLENATEETVNMQAEAIASQLRHNVSNQVLLEEIGEHDLIEGPILVGLECDEIMCATGLDILAEKDNSLYNLANPKEDNVTHTNTEDQANTELSGTDFFGYEAESLTEDQKREALAAVGYDVSDMTKTAIEAAFESEQSTMLEDDGEEVEDEDDVLDLEPDLGEDSEEAEDEDEENLEGFEDEDNLEGFEDEDGDDVEEEDGDVVEEEDEDLVGTLVEQALDSDQDAEVEAFEEAKAKVLEADYDDSDFDQCFNLAMALGLIDEDDEVDEDDVRDLLAEFAQIFEDSPFGEDEETDFEEYANQEEQEVQESEEEAEDGSRYLKPVGSNVLGEMYSLDVSQVLVINFTFTGASQYEEVDMQELQNVDGVNYLFPFNVGGKRAAHGAMLLPSVRTIDLMDNMALGNVLIGDASRFNPNEFAQRYNRLMEKGLAEALYEDRVPEGVDPDNYDIPVGDFAEDDDAADIAFIEGDETYSEFSDLMNSGPSLPITQLYSGKSTLRRLDLEGHCGFTNGIVLNFAVPGFWMDSLPEDRIEEMVQSAITSVRLRVAGNASCPTYCAFTYDSALVQSNDRVFELISALRTQEDASMSFTADDVKYVESARDSLEAVATLEDRDLPLTLLMSGATSALYDQGGNTTVIFPMSEEEEDSAEEDEE